MRIFFFPVLAVLLATEARAIDYNYTNVVKEEWTSGWQAIERDIVPSQINCRRISFTPRVPAASISPFSDDPRTATSDSNLLYWPSNDCSIRVTPDRYWTAYFHFRARSLQDLGQHVIMCDGLASPATSCVSASNPPCNIVCNPLYAMTAQPIRWFVDVINIAPEAFPTYSPTNLAWNSTVTLDAKGRDLDNPSSGDTNKYRWSITSRPAGSTASLVNPNAPKPVITFSGERDLGTWQFRLEVDDNEGQIRIYDNAVQFTVPNAPPNFDINGLTQVVVNRPIQLGSSRTTDDDGGDLTFTWDILQTPPTSALRPQSNYSTAYSISIPTTKTDIGDWVFRLTAQDNEGASVSKTVTVKVINARPRIVFNGPSEIDIGQDLLLSTTVLTDDDGGNLSFLWEVVQQPDEMGIVGLPYIISTTSALSLPALWIPGTFIFRLTAMDDEGESVQAEFNVLVDGLPYAFAVDVGGDDGENPAYPLTMNQGELVLYSWADDPDSPCPETPSRCHHTDGRGVSISPGIVRYEWHIIQLPAGINDRGDMQYWVLGRVSDDFSVQDTLPTLDLSNQYIPEGLWGFELRVWDGEGNQASFTSYVLMGQEVGPPFAGISSSLPYPGNRVTLPLSGILATKLEFYGSGFDADNWNPYDPDHPLEPWAGITYSQWSAIPPTAECQAPTLPTGPTVVLYPQGMTLPPACQGRWRIRLFVIDDDQVPKSYAAEHTVSIGNCAGAICLDSPRQLTPAIISTEGSGGVFIGYHIDSALYDETVFGLGVSAKLEIFMADNTLNPLYTSLSGPATQASRGRPLVFYWNGFTSSGTRVLEGMNFHVKVSLLDVNSNVLGSQMEYYAIKSEPLRVVFNEPPTKYVRISTSGTVSFTLSGALSPIGYYQGVLRDSMGNVVQTVTAPATATALTINYFVPGRYTLEFSVVRNGTAYTVGTHPVVIYQYQLRPRWAAARLNALVNNDDDNLNGVKDLEEAQPAGDDELLPVDVVLLPPLDGTLIVEQTLGADALKAWKTLSKSAEVMLPKTWNLPGDAAPSMLYLEPLKEARGEVRLRFTTADGTVLPLSSFPLDTLLVEAVQDTDGDHVVEDDDVPLSLLRAGRWDNAYDATFNVINGADPNHFVDRDPSRFYVRARGPGMNLDPARAEPFAMRLAVQYNWTTFENSTPILLSESGANTGVAVSRSQMLTGLDIEGIPRDDTDDGYPVHDGVSQVVADNAPGDRTWRASIDSQLNLSYWAYDGIVQSWRIPVCGPTHRKVKLRIHIFLEPYQDIGVDADGDPNTADRFGARNGKFDYVDANQNGQHDLGERSEPYYDLSEGATSARSGDDPSTQSARGPITRPEEVQRELRHTDSLWSPACIKTEQVGPILFENGPLYNFNNILVDGVIDNNEFGAVYSAFQDIMTDPGTQDVIEVFYGPEIYWNGSAYGAAFPPLLQTSSIPHGEKLFTIIASNHPNFPVLAHELAHLLTNTGDSHGNRTYFYPTDSAPLLTQVNSGRRMPEWVELDARTTRPLGDNQARGNRVLTSY